MTRKRKAPAKKPRRGVLVGMRQGVKKMAKSVVDTEPAPRSRWNLFWNVLTGIAIVVAGVVFLQRCGVIHLKL